ncbi:MAG TPA: GNAT family N-acetyltransferase [Gemmatimonadaceae bacterium]|nr:GNAT family N-acetyltransferase [Gemmatimonadaceae bacterium]
MSSVTGQPPWRVEKALPADAAELSSFAERSFRDAFGALNAPADVDAYCTRAFTPLAQQLELANPDMTTFLVRKRAELLGYAQLQEAEPHAGVEELPAILLRRIYVDQDWLGTGVAKALMQAVAAEASVRGARSLWLTVWERNPRAIRFYSRLGMRPVGEAVFLLGCERQRDLVMVIPIVQLSGVLGTAGAERRSG